MTNCSVAGMRAEFPYNDNVNDGCISITLENTFFRKAEEDGSFLGFYCTRIYGHRNKDEDVVSFNNFGL